MYKIQVCTTWLATSLRTVLDFVASWPRYPLFYFLALLLYTYSQRQHCKHEEKKEKERNKRVDRGREPCGKLKKKKMFRQSLHKV